MASFNLGTGKFQIQIISEKIKEGSLVLFDIQGRKLDTYHWLGRETELSVNLESYPKGLYLVKMIGNKGTYLEHAKVLVQ